MRRKMGKQLSLIGFLRIIKAVRIYLQTAIKILKNGKNRRIFAFKKTLCI